MANWVSATSISRTPDHLRRRRSTPELKALAKRIAKVMRADPESPFYAPKVDTVSERADEIARAFARNTRVV